MKNPPRAVARRIEKMIQVFIEDRDEFVRIGNALVALLTHRLLQPYTHSVRFRIKDPEHLRDKLLRKYRAAKAEGRPFTITPDNLYEQINDLVGVRLLHLHTTQFESINTVLVSLLNEELYEIVEGPKAHSWDDEYREYYRSINVEAAANTRMYTSVHYVVRPGSRKIMRTAEIQVRTLAEELWGEVDHSFNYPNASDTMAVREQIRVLARMTSSCTRLVDSIFKCAI
jgi:putative GTP pyrophosphokinase